MALESISLEAWKLDREPMENQELLEAFDFWLTLDLIEVTDFTERPDSKLDVLIEEKAAMERVLDALFYDWWKNANLLGSGDFLRLFYDFLARNFFAQSKNCWHCTIGFSLRIFDFQGT